MGPEKDFIGVRCYGTIATFDRATGEGRVTAAFGRPLTFNITALDDELLNWLSPGMPISFIPSAAQTGPPTATEIRPGGPALTAVTTDRARRNGTSLPSPSIAHRTTSIRPAAGVARPPASA